MTEKQSWVTRNFLLILLVMCLWVTLFITLDNHRRISTLENSTSNNILELDRAVDRVSIDQQSLGKGLDNYFQNASWECAEWTNETSLYEGASSNISQDPSFHHDSSWTLYNMVGFPEGAVVNQSQCGFPADDSHACFKITFPKKCVKQILVKAS